MALPPTDAPFIGWDWDVVHDADLNDELPPLRFNGAVIDLTGCTITLYIRPSYDFTTAIAILVSPTNITIDDADDGLVTVFVAKATVDNWPVGEWQFFLTVTDGTGKIAEVARGPFRIHAGDITA
jgi:hypothetical protein